MMGGLMDGIALALTSSLHIKNGMPLEGSWDNYFYTRQWNTPPERRGHHHAATPVTIRAAPASWRWRRRSPRSRAPTPAPPGRCRRTSRSTTARSGFEPLPLEPSTPQSPTDGLDHTF